MKLLIGVTGSFGSGKSTVARMLARMSGGFLVDADKIARRLVNGRLRSKVIKEFGTVNRRRLADIVFSDKKMLDKLNAIVHPAVKKEINKRVKSCKKVAILDVPLLIEAGISVDKIIVVKTKRSIQISRNRKRFEKADITRRIRSQMPMKEKLKRADYVVDNSGSLKQTEKQVKKIWIELSSGRS